MRVLDNILNQQTAKISQSSLKLFANQYVQLLDGYNIQALKARNNQEWIEFSIENLKNEFSHFMSRILIYDQVLDKYEVYMYSVIHSLTESNVKILLSNDSERISEDSIKSDESLKFNDFKLFMNLENFISRFPTFSRKYTEDQLIKGRFYLLELQVEDAENDIYERKFKVGKCINSKSFLINEHEIIPDEKIISICLAIKDIPFKYRMEKILGDINNERM